jgi:hypothetical protein
LRDLLALLNESVQIKRARVKGVVGTPLSASGS